MALNSFLAKFKTDVNPPQETFLALEIFPETIKSAIWLVEKGETQVLKVGTIEEWEEKDEGSFLKSADVAISSASEGIVPEPKGILFGLPEDWVEKDTIITERKHLLRQVCEKLDLKPLGFVVALEAIVQYFKNQQGTPLNAILIRFTETDLLVSLVIMGKIVGTETVGKTEDLVADVKEGLARFSDNSLPPRMILYDGMTDFEEAKQQLLSFDWQKELPFLHFPKIESLSRETSVRAVAIAGGSEVARSLGLEVEESPPVSIPETEAPPAAVSQPAQRSEKIEEKPATVEETAGMETSPEPTAPSASSLGFVKNQDILQVKVTPPEEESPMTEAAQKTVEVKPKPVFVSQAAPEASLFPSEQKTEKLVPPSPVPTKPLMFLSSLGNKLMNFGSGLSHFFLSRRWCLPIPKLFGFFGFAGIIFILLTIAGLAFYWYLPKAEVVIYVTPKILEKELIVVADTKVTSLDINQLVIPATTQTMETEGKLSEATSGKKLVGDKARGKVTILNKTDTTGVFDKGTVLVGPNNLRFELTDEVRVASKSSSLTPDGEKITYGKAEVGIGAADIGPEYNLAAGTELSFKDDGTSRFSAKTDSGLSGGSSREIRAVADEDQKRLLQRLTDQLKGEAKDKLQTQVGQDKTVVEPGMTVETLKKSFDKKVGEEANDLTLNLALRLTALTLSRNDLNTFLLQTLSSSLTSDFLLKTEDIVTEIQEVMVTGDKAKVKLVTKAKLLPKYDVNTIRDNLVGKYPQLVQSYLATLPNFVKADIKISPKLPGKLGTLPRVKDKITIRVETKE